MAETANERVRRMRTIVLAALLALSACAGIPFVGGGGSSQLTVRELSALEGIPGGYAPADRRSRLGRTDSLALIRGDDTVGLSAHETTALESVFGAYGRVDKREDVRNAARLSLVASTQTPRVEARTISALEGIPRTAFGF